MLGNRPLPLTTLVSIHRSLAARAAFAGFVRDRAIACAVLPGFRLATTGNVVPDEAVMLRVEFADDVTLQLDSDRTVCSSIEHLTTLIQGYDMLHVSAGI